jgi:predicted unusual protein kinase regulating ubiquinone biosynthesis (AarF/ABC1/UbiB family)
MSTTTLELLGELPFENGPRALNAPDLAELFAKLSHRPVPTSALHRLWKLSGLHAQVGLAYLAHWTRSWFQSADARQRDLMETHLRAALKVLETMGYLRGAVMKLGQAGANFPDILPEQFADTLSRLHFEAPPMHYSLVREYLHDELGGDPEEIFAEFETTAFAAASLGQVHRARLKSGERVAVKVQYPGIARTIRADFRNLHAVLFPFRLSRDWDNLQGQFEEVQRMFDLETDYESEAAFLREARGMFREDDGIVVPRVCDAHSTRRVLTMEYIDGRNFYDFLASNPPQEVRNRYGELYMRAVARLLYAGRMEYGDPHPGNLLFLEDGRLGLIDFGCMRTFNDEEWDYMRIADHATTGSREDVIVAMKRGMDLTEAEWDDRELMDVSMEYCRWFWQPLVYEGAFDYSDGSQLRRCAELIQRFGEHASPKQKPVNVFIQRGVLSGWSLLYRLGARVRVKQICDEEVKITGWR